MILGTIIIVRFHGLSVDSRELFNSTIARENTRYVPLFPRDLTLGMDSVPVRTDEIFRDGTYDAELSAKCVLALQDYLGSDCTVGCIFTYGLESFGGLTKFPEKGIPYVSGYCFADPENLYRYDPSQILDGYLYKGMRRSCEIVRERRGDLAMAVNVPGPMTMAGFARGLETLMMDLAINPELSDRILAFSADAIEHEMLGMAEGIADSVFYASASDNPDMIGLDDFTNRTLPAIKRLTESAHRAGLTAIFHPHGVFSTEDRESILEGSVATGIDGFQFSEGNEPEYIGEGCRGRCCVLGGVDAFSTLLLGPDKRIVRDTMRFIDTFADDPFVMMCSCSVNRGLSLPNLKVMADTVHAYNGGSQ